MNADVSAGDGSLQLEADLVRLRTLQDLQGIFILHVVKVHLGTEQLVTCRHNMMSDRVSLCVYTSHSDWDQDT